MNAWTLLLTAIAALAATATADKKIVCYFGSWSVYRPDDGQFDVSQIDPRLCTHMIYTFVGLNTDGSVRVLDPWQDLADDYGKDGIGRFNRLREQSPGTKTLVAIGGWNEGSSKFSQVAADPSLRSRFAQNVLEFVLRHNFDGFDVDWEYPNQRGGRPEDKQNLVALLKELRARFEKHGLLLSAAVGAAEHSASLSYDVREMSRHLDFVNLMAYDLHGSWDPRTGLNAPLYAASTEAGDETKLNVDAAVRYWLGQGAPADKLILGVPFYGRSFTLTNPSSADVGAPAAGPGNAGPYTREAGMLGYNEICADIQNGGWTVRYNEEQRAPFAFKGNQWIGYDDVRSISEKADYVKKHNLGGAMLWSIETDDFRGKCGERYPLLKTLNRVLRDGVPVTSAPPDNRPTSKPPTAPPATGDGVCKKEGYVRDAVDCSKFYFCQLVNGAFVVSEFKCTNGLVFDPTLNVCNYKDQVSC